MSQDQDTNPNAVYEEKYAGMTTIEVIRAMDKLSGEKESIEDELKEINKEYDFLRLNLIPKKFEDDGIENLRVEGIGRVSLTGDMYVSIPACRCSCSKIHGVRKICAKASSYQKCFKASDHDTNQGN